MESTEKKIFKHGGSWAVDLPMQFAKTLNNQSVVIEASPEGLLIRPKTELDTMEQDPLFRQFVRALGIHAMKHPEKLHDIEEVWDEEWDDLLQGVDIEAE
jgi:antitoxin component of MazEF toxin-antitoxin module